MNADVRASIKLMVEEGKSRAEVRSALMEMGYRLEDHYDAYYGVLDELGQKEDVFAAHRNLEDADYHPTPKFQTDVVLKGMNLLAKTILVIIVLVLVIVIATGNWRTLLSWVGIESDKVFDGMTVEDIAHIEALESYAWSANTYRNRLLDYGGMCTSIGIDQNLYTCNANAEAFVIETKLSTSDFYCVDHTGFSGHTMFSRAASLACE